MKRLLLAALAVSLVFACPVTAAGDVEVGLTARFKVPDSGRTVTADLTITPERSGDFAVELPITGISEPKLTVNGDTLAVTTEDKEIIRLGQKLRLTVFKFSLASKKTAELSFQTDSLLREYGKSTVFSLPAVPGTGARLTSVELTIPVERGLAVSYGATPSDTSIGSGQQTYRFEAGKSGDMSSVMLLFGTATTVKLNWQRRVANGSWWWRRVSVILPPDTNQQTVYLESVNPKPTRMSVDRDGNLIAEYRIGPKKSVNVEAKALIGLRSVTYNTTNTRTLADIAQTLKNYTTGNSAAADEAVLDVVREHYNKTLDSLKAKTDESRYPAAEVTRLGDTLRSAGVPAREILGIRFIKAGAIAEPYASSNWLEVSVPGIGWMTVDPLSDQFGRSDFQRAGLAIVSPISTVKADGNTEGLSVEFSPDQLPPADYSKTRVSVTKYVLLPFISLVRTSADLPPGVVLDNAAVSGSDIQVGLGSLAPLQADRYWSLAVGGAAHSTGDVQFGRGGESGLGEVLATGPASLSFWGVVAEVVGLALIIAAVIKWRRSESRVGKLPTLNQEPEDSGVAAEDLLDGDR